MSMKSLLSKTPDVDAFWQKVGRELEPFGYVKEDIKTVDDLINLKIISKAIHGDLSAKKFIEDCVHTPDTTAIKL